MLVDGLGADEQSRADLQVGGAFAGQPGDLGLLGGEVLARLDGGPSGAQMGAPERVSAADAAKTLAGRHYVVAGLVARAATIVCGA